MKIAFVLSRCKRSGSSRNVIEVAKYLSEWGHEVHIFANTCDPLVKNVRFHKIPEISGNYLVRNCLTTVFETLLMKLYKFDVTVAQPSRYFSPDVCHVRILQKIDANRNTITNALMRAPERYNLKKSKHIIAMSNSIKHDIVKHYGVPESKISVIYDGVNLGEFDTRKRSVYCREIKEKLGISDKDFVLLFAGNPFSRKGLEFVIRALPHIKRQNTKLLVVGNDNIIPYMEVAKRLDVADSIIHVSFTDEIYKYFATANAFVLPTLYEPFGLVITEAMASGIPVITSASAGAAELIDDGKDGLLLSNPKNEEEIAEKINALLEGDIAEKLGKAARKKIEQYTWERTAREMLKVFQEVVT